MRCLNSKVATVGIFLAAVTLLITYLLSIRWHIYLPVAVFWLAITLMLATIVYQSLQSRLSPGYAKVVLLEIAIACLAFHLIYQIPYYGLYGSDAYKDMASVKGILSSGFVMGDPQYTGGASYFPMIHVLGAQLSLITNIDLLSVAKWFPSLLDVALILLLYLLVRNIFKEERIALLSALLFACLQHHMLLSSLFIRETIALVLAVCCLYLYLSARPSAHPVTYYALSLVCLAGTVFAHHLTSFMLLVFLLVHFLVTKASELPFLRRTYFGDNITGEDVSSSFVLITFVAVFAYWIYVVISPLYTLVTFAEEVFSPSQWGMATYGELAGISATSIQTIRGYIIFYGFYTFLLIFGTILLYQLLLRGKKQRVETYSFTLFLFLCGISGLIELYVIRHGIAPFPDRFLIFGWLLSFAPLVMVILRGKRKLLTSIGIFLLVAFMFFNIYMIEPTTWDATAEGVPSAPTEADYALARTIDFSTGKIAGYQGSVMAIYDVRNNLGTCIYTSSEVDLQNFEWVIVNKKEVELWREYYRISETDTMIILERLVTEGSIDYDKIYDSNNLSVFEFEVAEP